MGVFPPGALARAARSGRSVLATRLAAAFAAEHDRWILWLPVLIGVGIGLYFSLPTEPPSWLGVAALMVVAAACLVFRHAVGSAAYLSLILTGAIAAGFAAAQLRTAVVAAPVVEERVGPAPIFGRIVKLERLGKGRRVTLDEVETDRLLPEETPARVRLRLNGKQPDLAPGDRVRIYGVLSPPSPPDRSRRLRLPPPGLLRPPRSHRLRHRQRRGSLARASTKRHLALGGSQPGRRHHPP